ncbi:MAG: hypothetical protein IJA86_05245 [Clostridia bacterium]|nr:hypothetical protein [Clostridia bacterium]
MKPVFGIDITKNKNNTEINGKIFITKTISEESEKRLDKDAEDFEETMEKSKLPLWIRVVKSICLCFGMIVIAAVIRAGIQNALQNAPWLIIAGIVCLIIGIILQIWASKKSKAVFEAPSTQAQERSMQNTTQALYDELGVPLDAVSVDVLLFQYTCKNGNIKPKIPPFQSTPYFNLDMKLYRRDNFLCLADLTAEYSFPFSSLKAIRTVNKRISVPSWNKEEASNEGIYKPYKITVNNIGDCFFKPYHILEIEHEAEIWEITFPCYELPHFEQITDLRAECEK